MLSQHLAPPSLRVTWVPRHSPIRLRPTRAEPVCSAHHGSPSANRAPAQLHRPLRPFPQSHGRPLLLTASVSQSGCVGRRGTRGEEQPNYAGRQMSLTASLEPRTSFQSSGMTSAGQALEHSCCCCFSPLPGCLAQGLALKTPLSQASSSLLATEAEQVA